jgi:hypothetical protein
MTTRRYESLETQSTNRPANFTQIIYLIWTAVELTRMKIVISHGHEMYRDMSSSLLDCDIIPFTTNDRDAFRSI